jgi:cyanophycinase
MPSPVTAPRGAIVPIGGAEDKIAGRAILRRFAEVCTGPIAIVTTASLDPLTGDRYREVFASLGTPVRIMAAERREDVTTAPLEGAGGVFFTGGAQLRLSTILGGTPLATLVRRMNAAGVPVGGTSAGAAFLSEHMIAFGREGGTP